MSVQEYLDKHRLSQRIEESVNAAVRAKADDLVLFVVTTSSRPLHNFDVDDRPAFIHTATCISVSHWTICLCTSFYITGGAGRQLECTAEM